MKRMRRKLKNALECGIAFSEIRRLFLENHSSRNLVRKHFRKQITGLLKKLTLNKEISRYSNEGASRDNYRSLCLIIIKIASIVTSLLHANQQENLMTRFILKLIFIHVVTTTAQKVSLTIKHRNSVLLTCLLLFLVT